MSIAARTSKWLDMQGYALSEQEKRRLVVPIKVAPVLCTGVAAAALATQSAGGFALLALIALAGAALPRHPFDYLYGWSLSRALGTGWAPRTPGRRKLQCGAASVMLAATAAAFGLGYTTAGIINGAAFLAVGITVTLTNWCVVLSLFDRLTALLRPAAENAARQ